MSQALESTKSVTPISLPGHTFHFQSVYDNLINMFSGRQWHSTLPKLKAIAFKIVRWRPNSTFPNKHVKLYTIDHQDDVHYVPQFIEKKKKKQSRDGGVGVQASKSPINSQEGHYFLISADRQHAPGVWDLFCWQFYINW